MKAAFESTSVSCQALVLPVDRQGAQISIVGEAGLGVKYMSSNGGPAMKKVLQLATVDPFSADFQAEKRMRRSSAFLLPIR